MHVPACEHHARPHMRPPCMSLHGLAAHILAWTSRRRPCMRQSHRPCMVQPCTSLHGPTCLSAYCMQAAVAGRASPVAPSTHLPEISRSFHSSREHAISCQAWRWMVLGGGGRVADSAPGFAPAGTAPPKASLRGEPARMPTPIAYPSIYAHAVPCMGPYSLHGSVLPAWVSPPCMGPYSLHGSVLPAWVRTPCMGPYSLHGFLLPAWVRTDPLAMNPFAHLV
eukprot:364931-Chlamydomonas_euryale.AAC.2